MTDNKIQKMGFGATLLTNNPDDGCMEWMGKIEGPPSSTRAELFAIMTAL